MMIASSPFVVMSVVSILLLTLYSFVNKLVNNVIRSLFSNYELTFQDTMQQFTDRLNLMMDPHIVLGTLHEVLLIILKVGNVNVFLHEKDHQFQLFQHHRMAMIYQKNDFQSYLYWKSA